MRTTRRKLKKKTPIIICSVVLAALLLGGVAFAKIRDLNMSPGGLITPLVETMAPTDRLNVLLLGIDARGGETMARSDSMILASVDQKSKQLAFLSIPRDTRVLIPGYGTDKINAATSYGGPELAAKTVSQLLGITVKNYVMVDFNAFKSVVDILGGITYDVEQNMYHWDNEDNYAYHIDLEKGPQLLDGDKALQYVRYRDYPMGDIDRTAHQQKFLMALAQELLQPSTITKLPELIPEVNRYVKTNLSLKDMYKLASVAKSLDESNFVAQTLPGRPVDINGSYWWVEPTEAKQVVAKLFAGETTTSVVLNTPVSGIDYGSSSGRYAEASETPDEDGAENAAILPGVQTPSEQDETDDQTTGQTSGNEKTTNKQPAGNASGGSQQGSANAGNSSGGSSGGSKVTITSGEGNAGTGAGSEDDDTTTGADKTSDSNASSSGSVTTPPASSSSSGGSESSSTGTSDKANSSLDDDETPVKVNPAINPGLLPGAKT